METIFRKGAITYLRPVRPADAPLIAQWKRDPLVQRMALRPGMEITDAEQLYDIRRALRSERELYGMIVVQATDEAIGYVRVNWMGEGTRFAWLRFALGAQRGQGYAKDAVRAMLAHCFELGAHRIEAEVYSFNRASRALLAGLGFRKEGVKRQAHFDGERYSDVLVLGLLEGEWQ